MVLIEYFLSRYLDPGRIHRFFEEKGIKEYEIISKSYFKEIELMSALNRRYYKVRYVDENGSIHYAEMKLDSSTRLHIYKDKVLELENTN
ncbi:hypothetical protein VDG1235_4664 [Verrucomicrobiia bacterium DG1235]|nr:hypothetical protein VDG1235_4664 [Verrucomicrobiae bacterium DG1235]